MRAMAAFLQAAAERSEASLGALIPSAGPGAERPAGTVPKGRGRKAERLPGREAARMRTERRRFGVRPSEVRQWGGVGGSDGAVLVFFFSRAGTSAKYRLG